MSAERRQRLSILRCRGHSRGRSLASAVRPGNGSAGEQRPAGRFQRRVGLRWVRAARGEVQSGGEGWGKTSPLHAGLVPQVVSRETGGRGDGGKRASRGAVGTEPSACVWEKPKTTRGSHTQTGGLQRANKGRKLLEKLG